MSASRACRPCRRAKTKCDLQRPTCNVCKRRQIVCYGYVTDSEYFFRDQNETARINSQRARRHRFSATRKVFQADLFVPGENGLLTKDEIILFHQKSAPWLHAQALIAIPPPVLCKLEDRILDIFYVEWILNPCQHGKSPGYLDLLPVMKVKAAPASALSLAVEAFAFANVRHLKISDNNLTRLSLSKYGAALAAVRSAIAQKSLAADDCTLMAILTIDMFEVVFMVRDEPLALHNNAIEHLLTVRGTEQVMSTTGFTLYRMANHRLQVRQLGLGHIPLPVQLACMDMLDTSTPSLSLEAIHLRAQQTLGLCQGMSYEDTFNLSDHSYLNQLIERINLHLDELEQWKVDLPISWRPKCIRPTEMEEIRQTLAALSLPVFPHLWTYEDPWIAHQMTFFYQGQLALRTAMIDVLAMMGRLSTNHGLIASLQQEVIYQETAISRLADVLVESTPPLLGSIQLDSGGIGLRGKKITSCFARAICWTLQQGKLVSKEHKELANKVEECMRNMSDMI